MSRPCRLACNWPDRVSVDAFSSHVEKWTAVQPELALALRFAHSSARPAVAALACLDLEIAHAALNIAERDVALLKLNWWAEELAALAAGAPRHPLTQVLAGQVAFHGITSAQWRSTVAAAMAMREAPPAANLAELMSRFRQYAVCWGPMQQALHARINAEAWVEARTLALALREGVGLQRALRQDRLPLAMDLLARHQLSRNELGQHSETRDQMLREHFSTLAKAMRGTSHNGLTVHAALQLHADEYRCRNLAKASAPSHMGQDMLLRLPFSAAWVAWRAARNMQADA